MSIQPPWGPVGYSNADYYYLPDIEVYYDVYLQQFIYQKRGAWKISSSLPARYATFNLYRAHKVVINEQKPYLLHENYKAEYSSFKGQNDQVAIRDSHDSRYSQIKDHPEHYKGMVAQVNERSQNQRKARSYDQHKDHRKSIATR